MENKVAILIGKAIKSSVLKDEIGHFVTATPIQAFEFATITGAGYCTNTIFPFSPRPYSKIFGAALKDEYTSGMMDQGLVRYSTPTLAESRPFLTSGMKYIYSIAITNELEYKQKLKEIARKHSSPSDVIVFRIEAWKKGFGLEPLLEYLATIQFSARGFISENQAPLSATLGSPDFLAFRLSSLNRDLNEVLGVPIGISLARINAFFTIPTQHEVVGGNLIEGENQIVVGEAKVAGTDGFTQLDKYLSSGYFSASIFLTDGNRVDERGLHQSLSTRNFEVELPAANLETAGKSEPSPYSRWLEAQTITHLIYALPAERRRLIMARFQELFHTIVVKELLAIRGRRRILDVIKEH